ncbi:MAG: hypothetical protein ACUVUF_05780 [Candidatus Bathycorpusculaceae bacterium]
MLRLGVVDNRYKIALWCTFFNMVFEYSMRGINNIARQPVLFPLLFGTYFTYFLALEDLIVRFKLQEEHLLAIAFFFGTFYITFATGIVFVNPNLMGINVVNLLFVNIVWWGLLQAILTFYFANRLTRRDWNHPTMGKCGWALIIFYQILMLLLFQFANPNVPKGSTTGYFTITTIFAASFVICAVLIRRQKSKFATEPTAFKQSLVLDVLAFGSAFLFFILAVFFTSDQVQSGAHQINQSATNIVIFWSLVVAAVMAFYRFKKRSPFPF